MEIDSVHFYVGNANKTSMWFVKHLGFTVVDRYQDRQNLTIAVACASVLVIISSPLHNQGLVAAYLDRHSEGIVDISFQVSDLQALVQKQKIFRDISLVDIHHNSQVSYCVISGWGSVRHTLLTTEFVGSCYSLPNGELRIIPALGYLQPGKIQTEQVQSLEQSISPLHFTQIDHVVLNVAKNHLQAAVLYYQDLFAWRVHQTFEIATQSSGLSSQALIDTTGMVKFNINEPTTNNSQIQEFLDLNNGAGIQHLALRSLDLIADVAQMRNYEVDFLPIPDAYYTQLEQDYPDWESHFVDLDWRSIAQQKILVDRQRASSSKSFSQSRTDALLLQIFTQPILAQPTFFLEFIERYCQAEGFGEGNFQALFAAVEAGQIKSLR